MTIMKKDFYIHRSLEIGDIAHRAIKGESARSVRRQKGQGESKGPGFLLWFSQEEMGKDV